MSKFSTLESSIGIIGEAPILFITFNRLKTTKRVFEKIRKYQPKKLFIAADGPRNGMLTDNEQCETVRHWLLENTDWPCEVFTLFRNINQGCGRGPSEAISWFFSQVDEGIILEDDCLPNDSFFKFCEENLEKHRNDERVSIISGNNFLTADQIPKINDYYFSIFPSTWGWATWKRTWEGYDQRMSLWRQINQSKFLATIFPDDSHRAYWKEAYDRYANDDNPDTWDFQFYFHTMSRKQLAIIPRLNLVSNIGHDENGTHTTNANCALANLQTYELTWPLNHPETVERNFAADHLHQQIVFGEIHEPTFLKRLKRIIKTGLHLTR